MEFQQALGFKDKNMAKRIFRIFDENNDQVITFREFVVGLSILCKKGSEEEKLKCTYNNSFYSVVRRQAVDQRSKVTSSLLFIIES